jgi:N-acetylmuramoyl-L-alanine amidase
MLERTSREISKIIVHCSATREEQPVSVETIRKWHKLRGWSDIGYHYIVDLNGQVHAGRDVSRVGAHVKGHNTGSVGVCYIGGLDKDGEPKDTRTFEQDVALTYLLKLLTHQYEGSTLHGHNEFSSKACPCFDVQAEYGWIIE